MLAFLFLTLLSLTFSEATLVWAIVAGVAASAAFTYMVARDTVVGIVTWRQRKKLRKPCEIHFWVPKTAQGILGYVSQDNEEHRADVLILPSGSEIQIGLWMKPKLPFGASSWYFGFEGALQDKPEPIKYYNPLVYAGLAKENSPQQDRTHYIDIHRYYHIIEERVRLPSEVYVSGFIVKTHKPGDYVAQVLFHSDEGRLGLLKLRVRVEEPMITKTVCVQHANCLLEPKLSASQSRPGSSAP